MQLQDQCGYQGQSISNTIKTSRLALWSLICGIVGMIILLPAPLAIILGIVALVKINTLKGSWMAITGIILGCIAIIICSIYCGMIIGASGVMPINIQTNDTINNLQAKTEIEKLTAALLVYDGTHSGYPTNEQGLQVLKGDLYKNEIPKDPWGKEYHYRYPGLHNPPSYDIWSDGKDGVEGTVDDITNWHE